VEKAFWDETKSYLQSKVASVALKRGKTPGNWIFQSPRRQPPPSLNYVPRGEPLLQLTLIRTNHVWTELVFCQASSQKAIAASIFNNWLWKKVSRCSPSSIFCIFHTSGLLSPPESEIREGKLLDDQGHLEEELVGGRPHHRYIKACCRRPRVFRALQKKHIADDHAKKLPEASVSLK
jgi:hypothetical protein